MGFHVSINFFFQNSKISDIKSSDYGFQEPVWLCSDFSGLTNLCSLFDLTGLNSLWNHIFSKNFLVPIVWSLLAPKWPIVVNFCGMDHQKSNFSLVSDTLSIGGCWGQPTLFFWNLADETQMVKPPEPTSHHDSRKYLILIPLRAIYFRSLYYETPCTICKIISFLHCKT